MKRRSLLLALLLGAATAAWGEPPSASAPVALRQGGQEYALGMSLAELEKRAGRWTGDESGVFPNGLRVLLSKDHAINLSVTEGEWRVGQPGRDLVTLGEEEAAVRSRLGPAPILLRKLGLEAWIYTTEQVDLGLLLQQHRVAAITLTRAGKLENIMFLSGYKRIWEQ